MTEPTKAQSIAEIHALGLDYCATALASIAGARPDETPFVAVPKEMTIESLEHFLPAPKRIRNTISFGNLASIIAYTDDFKPAEGETRRALIADDKLEVIFDANQPGQPAWQSHKALLPLTIHEDFQKLIDGNRQFNPQYEFAELVADLVPYIQSPEPATLLEIAQELQGHTGAKWKFGKRLRDGNTSFEYSEETTTTTASSGKVEVPPYIDLNIPVFQRGKSISVRAELRFKVTPVGIQFATIIRGLVDIIDNAVSEVAKEFTEKTSLPVFRV